MSARKLPDPRKFPNPRKLLNARKLPNPRKLVNTDELVNTDTLLRLVGMRYASAALMLVGVAALYGAATFSRPGDVDANGREAPVTSAVMVCPGHEGGRLAVQSLASPRKGGRVDMTPTKGGAALASMTSPGQSWEKDTESGDDSYTLRATGAMAAGLEAEQTTYEDGGDDRGLAGARCASPATDQWFIGPGPVAADELDLYLTNVDSQPASVDVIALSGEGPLDTIEGRGTRVEPYTTRVVKIGGSPEGLGDVVKSAADLALRVRTNGGRVTASLRVRAGEEKGIEWLPRSPAPAPSVVVPGVPGGPGKRRLLISVPGESDARIRTQVITKDGAFAPQGQDVLDAPGKTVTSLAIDGALVGKAGAVRLVADRPIVAGFAADRGADIAYGTSTPPLDGSGPGIVADNRFDSSLVLTAPSGAATVEVTTVNATGKSAPQVIEIPAGRTVETALAAPNRDAKDDTAYGVVIVPKAGSGPVHASRTLSKGKDDDYLFTVLPITPAAITVHLPDTVDTQGALTPG
ncbi:hypothetical protein E1287_19415 [Actinomadura sp. KC06]|uniref:DUF5719 family protein n=1 Tax=Actinomadura sp. KC06 TaxID=2530369 RepID=UPI00104FD7ED|nr:DUF5719 family protein [Actinomadura sp. KC06]TDD33469.1 hypothetical protein E1287_19415 [Actinomadura sp. KC06]